VQLLPEHLIDCTEFVLTAVRRGALREMGRIGVENRTYRRQPFFA